MTLPASEATWTAKLAHDLRPTPGRLALSLRLTLVIAITLVVIMVFRLPAAYVGLYFAFLANRETPSHTLRSSLYMVAAVAASVAVELLLVAASENAPVVRPLSLALMIFVAGVFIHESNFPFMGTIFGFIYSVIIASWETHAPARALVENNLWLIVTPSVGLGASVLVEYLFAYKAPADRLQEERLRRYVLLESMFSLIARGASPEAVSGPIHEVATVAAEGQFRMAALFLEMSGRNLPSGELPPAMGVRIAMLAQLMDLSAAFGTAWRANPSPLVGERCARLASICRQLRLGQPVPESDARSLSDTTHGTYLDRVERGVREILNMPDVVPNCERRDLVYVPPEHIPIVGRRAFENPEALAFGLKLSACATSCYVFYNATGWPGLSTSVITVMVAATTGSGAVKQRLLFRTAGMVVGGLALGIGSVALLFPDMESIASLVILVGGLSFLFAWCSGGRQFGFFGAQLAFSFYSVAIAGPVPEVDLIPARDRFLGVVVAALVTWVVFDHLWPTTTRTLLRRMLASVLRDTSSLLALLDTPAAHVTRLTRARVLRHKLGRTIAGVYATGGQARYEFGAHRAQQEEEAARLTSVALATASFFWGRMTLFYSERDPVVPSPPDIVLARQQIARELNVLAAALEGENVDLQQTLVRDFAEPSAEGVRADPELTSARAGYVRIRDGVLGLVHPSGGAEHVLTAT